ncbi:hypothetical protein SAMN06265355_10737 [Actinomadura mexicana]|uniref:Uncharacterized protein n=1 Tax=Actinomadura mexicana TaxID=134959 RepID=A0A238Z823_9ACTN|nr:hypothetical protein SAMN06265355_10737 [Actinomadura mexicana]
MLPPCAVHDLARLPLISTKKAYQPLPVSLFTLLTVTRTPTPRTLPKVAQQLQRHSNYR